MRIGHKKILLKEVATFLNGYAFKPSDWSKEGLPIIRIQNLTGTNRDFNYYNGNYNKKYLVENGDILISWSASLGIFLWENMTGILNQHIFKVIFDKNIEIDKIYFLHCMKFLIKKIEKNIHGSTMKHITRPEFEKIKFPIYEIDIQRKISKKLIFITKIIENNKKLLNKMEELSKSLFTRMFGDIKTNDKNWEIKKLGEVVQTQYGTSKKATSIVGKFPILRMNNITYSGEMDYKDLKYIELSDSEKEKFLLKKGELLFNRTNSKELVGKTGLFNLDIPMAFAGYLIRIKPSNLIHSKFLLFFMNSEFMKKLLYNKAKNIVGMANINAKELEDFSIILPPIELQNKFAERTEKIEKLKFEIEKSIEIAQNLYDSLISKYFDN